MWTLWGMGLSALGALLATMLSFIAQSPQFIARVGLSGRRLDLRIRGFTGLALACMLLAGGFFLAGVPLESLPGVTPTPQRIGEVAADLNPDLTAAPGDSEEIESETAVPVTPTRSLTPQSGSFSGPPPGSETDEDAAESGSSGDVTPAAAIASPLPTATPSPRPTRRPSSTPTQTPTPTLTPSPTLTPTPIEGETTLVNTGSSTLWVRRTPGGQTLVLVMGGDSVILQPGHAHQGGILWQEIMTLDGIVGWVEMEFLAQAESD